MDTEPADRAFRIHQRLLCVEHSLDDIQELLNVEQDPVELVYAHIPCGAGPALRSRA